MKIRSAVLALVGSLLVVACASGPEVRTVELQGDEQVLNLNRAGKSTPVNVRIYLLKEPAAFEAATFDALWDDAKGALDASLVGDYREVVVTTGNPTPEEIVLPEGVRFIGIAALFNEEQGPWRVSADVDEVDDLLFELKEYAIYRRER